MSETELLDNINHSFDIFSLISNVYLFLQSKPYNEIRKSYFNKIADEKYFDEFKGIDELINTISLMDGFDFSSLIEIWIDEFTNSKLDSIMFCYHFLLKIDTIINDFKGENEVGPLNKNENCYFYYKNNNFYYSKAFADAGIRKGRQTTKYDKNSINFYLENFQIINIENLNKYRPIIKKFKFKYKFGSSLKIGIVPLSREKWFNVVEDKKSKTFYVEYDSSKLEKHNNQIKDILIDLDKSGTNIAIFPELAMNKETEKYIQSFVNHSNFNNLKLIFLGSFWDNNKKRNEAILISAKGSILLRAEKNLPYSEYNKDDEQYYDEDICFNNDIFFIDIDGLGRISYLICADFNEEIINNICSVMNVDFCFVSAFSNSTELMFNTAYGNAKSKAISTVLCNSCAAYKNEKDNLDSFIVALNTKKKRIIAKSHKFGISSYCGKCDHCLHTAEIEPK